jgi:hypothetical protein
MRPKLRIGILTSGAMVPYWAARMMERIGRSSYAEIVLLVITGAREGGPRRSRSEGSLLYHAHEAIDGVLSRNLPLMNGKGRRDPFRFEELPAALDGIEGLEIYGGKDGHLEISQDVIGKLKGKDLDVLVDTGIDLPLDDISKCSRYGVLTFSPGDCGRYNGRYAGFWEIYDGIPVTGSHVRRTHGERAFPVYRSYSRTVTWSEGRNREQAYLKGISFIPRVLESLYQRGDAVIAPSLDDRVQCDGSPSPMPSNLDMLRFHFHNVPRNARIAIRKTLYRESWAIRYKLGEGIPTTFDDFVTMEPPKGVWWGDPHVARQGNDFFIFIEELQLPFGENRGHISVIRMKADGGYEQPVKVLERPYHLSNPFVFEWGGRRFMVPESAHGRTIELYEAVEFPYRWKHVKNIMTDVHAVDTTIVRREGLWWLFCNIKENEGAPLNDELFLFYSDDLFTDVWTPHPLSPVVTDVRRARPAGALFERDGVLYRPSQDCSTCYGYAINLNKVVRMDREHYQEEKVGYIEPRQFGGASRVHTMNHVPGITVVDTFVDLPRF